MQVLRPQYPGEGPSKIIGEMSEAIEGIITEPRIRSPGP